MGGGVWGDSGPPRVPSLPLLCLLLLLSMRWARRGLRFWLGVAPILLSYCWLLASLKLSKAPAAERAARMMALHESCAPRALSLATSLAGGYIKMGQVLSNRADLLPSPYLSAFASLQDDCPPRAWRQMEAALRADAPSLYNQLANVTTQPLGAASTGQAHLATLRNGSVVVLKLQYADARNSFGADLGNVGRLAALALPAMVPVVGEVRRRFRNEFDYEREGRDMQEMGAAIASREGGIVAPVPLLGLTTRRTLAMEYLEGEKLLTAVQRKYKTCLGEAGYR